jgi:DNA polymerase elongation subunit (family B)
LETTSLSPKDGRIFMIGIKDNRGFEEVIEIEDDDYSEILAITKFFETIDKLKPTIVGGYNSSNFDWDWLFERSRILGLDISEFKTLNPNECIKMSKGTIKLGAEVEEYNKIKMWGYNSIDIAHAVRRTQTINSDIKSWGLKYITKFTNSEKPNRVYVQGDKIASTYKENLEYFFNPKTGQYRLVTDPKVKDIEKKYPGVYERVNGKYIVERYLLDDIWETLEVDAQFNQASFLLSSMVPTSYERVSTMGTATLWKMLMLSWSYSHNLAIPKKDEKRSFVGGLSRLLKTGFSTNVLKLDFSSLYPSIQLVHDVFPECDVTGAMKSMLKYFRDTRIKYKNLTSEYKDTNKKLSETYGRKQLPIKIFINSMFGSLSAPQVFPWGDMNKGEEVTCTGRQYLRHMIRWFMDRDYEPLVLDTDGVNFSAPKDVETITYTGKGNNELVVAGKLYSGTDAHVAEYNDLFMINEMGLDTDGNWPACINVARKNYALLTDKGKIKLTGNSIKSKKLQGYVEEFIDKGLTMLLNGDGQSFVEYYYEYLDKIFNKKIPLSKIANKSNVKQSVNDYIIRSKETSKSGSLMSRQAHMELIIQEGLKPDLGDTIYYVNNGNKKSHGDVQSKKLKDGTDQLILNCYRIPKEEMENNPEMTGDYNVPRYISTFNNRVEPLLVCFKPETRDSILIDDPKDRQYFTKSQCELINGIPRKVEDQDSLSEILDLSEEEINFWANVKNQSESYFMESLGVLDTVR